MMIAHCRSVLPLLTVLSFFSCSAAFADDFRCEVMSVQGDALLSRGQEAPRKVEEGDLLKPGDALETGPNCRLDVAYDADWQNVTTVESNCSVTIQSVEPTSLELAKGSVFAKLDRLPKDSSFEVRTPTGVAVVRGTEFWTRSGGEGLEVYNYSASPVEVFGLDAQGRRFGKPAFLKRNEKTGILRRGSMPGTVQRMNAVDLQRCRGFASGIQDRVKQVRAKGRSGKIQKIRDMEQRRRSKPAPAAAQKTTLRQRFGPQILDRGRRAKSGTSKPSKSRPSGRSRGKS